MFMHLGSELSVRHQLQQQLIYLVVVADVGSCEILKTFDLGVIVAWLSRGSMAFVSRGSVFCF